MEQGEAVRRREAEKRKNEARRRRQKKRKRQQMFARSVMVLTGAVFVGVILYGGWRLSHRTAQAQEEIVAEETKYIADRPDFSVESAEKSSSVFHAMRLHMLQTTETAIRFP